MRYHIMKTKILVIALLLTITTLAAACPGGKHGDKHRKFEHRDNMASSLNLSDEQRQKFDAVMQDKRENMKAAMEVVHADIQSQLAGFLSEEQMQIMTDRKNSHANMRLHRKTSE